MGNIKFVGESASSYDPSQEAARLVAVNVEVTGGRILSSTCYIHEFPLMRALYRRMQADVEIHSYWAPDLSRVRGLHKGQLAREYERLYQTYVIHEERTKRHLLEDVYGNRANTRLWDAIRDVYAAYAKLEARLVKESREIRVDDLLALVAIASPDGVRLSGDDDMIDVPDGLLAAERTPAPGKAPGKAKRKDTGGKVRPHDAVFTETAADWDGARAILCESGFPEETADAAIALLKQHGATLDGGLDMERLPIDWAGVPGIGSSRSRQEALIRVLVEYAEAANDEDDAEV